MPARIPLEAGGFYHIFNHAVGEENIFREDENYLFFLRKCSSRIIPFADVVAFCLMPNHFHFLIRMKDKQVLTLLWRDKIMKLKSNHSRKNFPLQPDSVFLDELITTQFANLFNSYVQAFNKKYFRKGSLLKESFQRKRIDDTNGLLKTVCYIHNNPVEHHFTDKREGWKYSSYNAILSDGKTNIVRSEVLEMFGGRENFIFMHQRCLGVEI